LIWKPAGRWRRTATGFGVVEPVQGRDARRADVGVQGGVAAVADLRGRRGVFDAPYGGDVYFLDVVVCNPGAAGGALVNRKGTCSVFWAAS